MPTLHKTEID